MQVSYDDACRLYGALSSSILFDALAAQPSISLEIINKQAEIASKHKSCAINVENEDSRNQWLSRIQSYSLDCLAAYIDASIHEQPSCALLNLLVSLSGLENSRDPIARATFRALCKPKTGKSGSPETSIYPSLVSKRLCVLLQAALWRKLRQEDSAAICFFGASITQQKDEVSYVRSVYEASLANAGAAFPRIKSIKLGYGGMHLTDAGIFYLARVIEHQPSVCILEWHSSALSNWPKGILEKICYSLLSSGILPIVLVLPRALPEYFTDKTKTSRYKATIRLQEKMGIPVIDLTCSLDAGIVSSLTRDGTHTNELGAIFYGCRIYKHLCNIIRDAKAYLPFEQRFYGPAAKVFCDYHETNILAIQTIPVNLVLGTKRSIVFSGSPGVICVLNIRVGPFSPRVSVKDKEGLRSLSLFDPWCHFERDTLRIRFSLDAQGLCMLSVEEKKPDYSVCKKADFVPSASPVLILHDVLVLPSCEASGDRLVEFRLLESC